VAVNKINGFRAPYKSQTFREIAASHIGLNGILSIDGPVTQTGLAITIPAFTVIQQGLIYSKSVATSKTAPSMPAPYYLVVTSPTPGDIDNLIFDFTKSLDDITTTQVQLASYDGYEWSLPPIVSSEGIIEEIKRQNIIAGRVGPYYGLKTSITGIGYTGDYVNSPGALIDRMGQRRELFEDAIFPIVAADSDWRRVDRILYRRPSDSPLRIGSREFLLGGAYADTPAVLYRTHLFSSSLARHSIKVVTDSDNLAHVFATSGTGGSYSLTYGRIRSDRQAVLQAETTLISGLTSTEFEAVIDSSDFIHIIYVASGDLLYQKVDATGALAGSPILLTGGLTGTCDAPKGKLDPIDALYHVVFQANTGIINQIFYISIDVNLSAIATTARSLVTSSNNLVNPDIAVASDFILHIVWENSVTKSIYYQTFTTLLEAREPSPANISASVVYSGGGTLVNNATSPKVIVTDNLVPFVAFGQSHGSSQYGVSIWTPAGGYQKMLFSSSEHFSHYDLFIEDIFNEPSLIVARAGSVDVVKLQEQDIDFSLNLSTNACSGVALTKDRLGAFVVAWSDDTDGLHVAKTPAESYTMAYSYKELDSDLLLSRMIMPDGVVINWILGDKPGSLYDFLLSWGIHVSIGWETTTAGTLELSQDMGSGLMHVLDLFTDTDYTVAAGSYPMAEGEALYVTLDGVTSSVTPQVAPLALVPWDENAAVLGIIKGGEFSPVLLGVAGMTKLSTNEGVIFGEDLPQSIRVRLGILTDSGGEPTAFQSYSSQLAINGPDTYPQALSNLDIMSAQNRHARLVKFSGDWQVAGANVLRILSDCYVQIPGLTEVRNTVAAQSITLSADGDIAYVSLNRTTGAAATLTVLVASAASVIPGRNTFVVARRTPTGVEIDGQAVTYTDRLVSGQTNNVVVDGDTLEEAIKRLDVRQDVVKRVKVITRTDTTLPALPVTIDGVLLVNGDKVLFADTTSLNGIYQVVGTSWEKLYEFAGSQTPTAEDLVMVHAGAEINRTIWAYDLVKGWYRATTVDDTIPVRAMDLTTTVLPLAGPVVVDGETILEGELVLFGNAALNRVYRVRYSEAPLFEEMNAFTGAAAPRDGSTVLVQDGTVSDVIWEYDEDLALWSSFTLTTQNKTYLGLTSPSKSGGTFVDQITPGQTNNIVQEGDILEEAIKRLDIRPDVVKPVRVIDLVSAVLPATSATIDGVVLSDGDKVLFGNPLLPQGTGIFQTSGLSWVKLYEFAGSQTPTPTAAVRVTEGSHSNRTIWLYNASITPPWERVAGPSENIWTGADAVTAPTFNGTLSPDDTDMSKVLRTIDKYFRALQLREHPTDKMRVVVTASEAIKTDDTALNSPINSRIMNFEGAEVDFLNGIIYAADGFTVLGTFAPPVVSIGLYFWYGISLNIEIQSSNNTIIPTVSIDLGSGTGVSLAAAPRPTFTGDYTVGAVWIEGGNPGVENILQGNITQIGETNLAGVYDRITALETIVSIHTTEINELQNSVAAILANTPKRQVFISTGTTIFDLNPLEFSVENDNTRMDVDFFIDGRWQPQSLLGDFTDGAYRKNSTTQLETAEIVTAGKEVVVVKRDAGGIFANAVKIQRYIATVGGQTTFDLNPLVFTVLDDNTELDADYYVNGRWQKQTITGDFADGAVRKNSLTQVETAEPVPEGQEFTVVRRTPNGSGGGGGGGGSTDLQNIAVDLGFLSQNSVGTLAKPAGSVILRDEVTPDIWKLSVASGVLQIVKIN
jgi:hypothetical protein